MRIDFVSPRPEGVFGYVHRRRRSRVVVAFVVFLVVAGFGTAAFALSLIVPQGSPTNAPVTLTVPEGKQAAVAALREAGVLKYEAAFRLLVRLRGGTVHTGQYTITPHLSVWSLVQLLTTTAPRRERVVQVIEGWNLRDIGAYVEREHIATANELFALAGAPAVDYRDADAAIARPKDFSRDFFYLNEKPEFIGLEGYLFPDTYRVYEDASVEDILRKMLQNFDRKLTPELRAEIAASGRSLHQVLTMASIIEAEVARNDDRAIAAGILWKRRDRGMRLQVDASVNYATGKHDPRVSTTDAAVDSSYNTYRYAGLPRGPINNPGMDAILAALRPTQSPYWFFLTTTDGRTVFSKTIEEHNANIARYLR